MIGKGMSRKYLSADALIGLLRKRFATIDDARPAPVSITLTDALLSAFALFSLKDPSLLAFDRRRHDANLRSVYTIERVPCDTQMRTILDPVPPESLRPAFGDIFRQLQRGKVLESFVYLEEGYLLCLDGTGYFSSSTIHCPSCMEKRHADGTVTYYHQMLGAALVHPDREEVIPLAPEPIIKQDGQTKNDCERNAARRFLEKFRRDHPRLPVIVVEDALSSNAPHVRDLIAHDCQFILGVKEGDHAYLFEEVRRRQDQDENVTWQEIHVGGSPLKHLFSVVPDVPLNESNQEVRVTFVSYFEIDDSRNTQRQFTWITKLSVKQTNVWRFMKAGRARWKIENETFNTLKNQGYHFEHNFGHGEQNLSVVFALLMMLAFLVDQVQQHCCPLFQGAWKKLGSKRLLWERLRSAFQEYCLRSLHELWEVLCYGCRRRRPLIDSS